MSQSLSSEQWRERGMLFDTASHDYREGRPDYPREVFTLLGERCGLGVGSRVLEVGAGTGQATLPVLEMGASVTAVEPGAGLAERLVECTSGFPLRVIVSRFEDATITDSSYDLVVSATAFHWVDPRVGLAKAGAALRDHGWLALWWTVFGDATRPDPFHEALMPILRAKAPGLVEEGGAALSYALDLTARRREIATAGLYTSVEQHVIRWEGRHNPAEIRALFSTFSPWLALPEARRSDMLKEVERLARDAFKGCVTRPYQTVIYLAERRARETLAL
jgi:SAM-dependent methyltransferase